VRLSEPGDLERRRVLVHRRERVGDALQIVEDLQLVPASLGCLERPGVVLKRPSRLS
jgi:hypothetical protein